MFDTDIDRIEEYFYRQPVCDSKVLMQAADISRLILTVRAAEAAMAIMGEGEE